MMIGSVPFDLIKCKADSSQMPRVILNVKELVWNGLAADCYWDQK
jgi:hypothetical protein